MGTIIPCRSRKYTEMRLGECSEVCAVMRVKFEKGLSSCLAQDRSSKYLTTQEPCMVSVSVYGFTKYCYFVRMCFVLLRCFLGSGSLDFTRFCQRFEWSIKVKNHCLDKYTAKNVCGERLRTGLGLAVSSPGAVGSRSHLLEPRKTWSQRIFLTMDPHPFPAPFSRRAHFSILVCSS